MNAAIEVATSYLEDAAYSQYFYDAQDLVAHTIEVIPENEKAVLSQSIAEYPSFRSAQAVVPYEDTSINTGHSRLLRKTWSCIGTVLPTMGILTS